MKIVASDFDGTLTTRDTLLEFIKYTHGAGHLFGFMLIFSPLLVLMKLKIIDNGRMKERMFSHFFRGMAIDVFNGKCQSFAATHRHLLRPGGVAMIEKALTDGTEVAIVSASIDNWVQPFFPNVRVIGTQVEVANGKLTGRFTSRNCYGAEKVRRLKEVFPHLDDSFLVAYGDSSGDKELLAAAKERHYKPFRE